MSTIRKQSVFGSIIAVAGVAVGFMNSGFLQPKFLNVDEIGVLRYFLSLAGLLSIFASVGIGTVLLKYLPIAFKHSYERQISGLFTLVMFVGQIIGLFALYLYLNYLQNELTSNYFVHVYLFFSTGFLFNILSYLLNARGLVSQTLLARELFIKTGFVVALLGLYLFSFSFNTFLYFIEFVYVLASLLVLFFILTKKKAILPSFNFSSVEIPIKEISSLAFFSVMAGSIAILTKEIDVLMVTRFINFEATGIYSIMLFFGVLVSIPSRGLVSISSVKIGEAWANNDMKFIKDLYSKTAQNQLFVAGFVYVMLNANLFAALEFMPKGDVFMKGVWVVFWLGLAQLIDMASGVSGELLYYSKHFKYGFYFSIGLLVSLIGFNFIFIPMFGITGAAFATFLSQIINNFARWYFLKKFYKLQPFDNKFFKSLLFTLILVGVVLILREFTAPLHYVLEATVVSVPILVVYFLVVWFTDWAPDLKDRIKVYGAKFGILRS